jgi:hypothetical protein
MSTALLIGLVVVAALACPSMMWWQSRRGRAGTCIPGRTAGSTELQTLRARQDHLAEQIQELERREAELAGLERAASPPR